MKILFLLLLFFPSLTLADSGGVAVEPATVLQDENGWDYNLDRPKEELGK